MGPAWAAAFLVGVLLTVVGTPFLRRLALVTGFVDRPGDHKTHARPTPYLGGLGLIASVLAGVALGPRTGVAGSVICLGAAVLGTAGLIDDHRTVDPRIRLFSQAMMAALAVAVGLRVTATGVETVDMLITLVWIVGVTNAFNLLDNMDGLAAGVAATAASAVFVLSILSGQQRSAIVAAALIGGCLGFLVYNRRPASIFMGDAGSLFLGFVLAVLTIEVDPDLAPPASFAIPLLLLALPVLDTTMVTLSRLRRRRSVWVGGRDHLSHRLVARGLSSGAAVGVLIAVEAVMGVLAVAAGRRFVPLWAAMACGAFVAAALSLVAGRASVYPEAAVGLPRWLGLAVAGGIVGMVALAGPAVVAMTLAQSPARTGAALAKGALATVGQSGGEQTAEFERAGTYFRLARSRLDAPLVSLGLAVPGLSSNLETSRTLVSLGERLSAAGARLATLSEASQLRVTDGTISLAELRRLAPALSDAAGVLRMSRAQLAEANQSYLVPPIQRAVDDLATRLERTTESAERAADSARLLPAMLGGEGPRRYFLAFQNNAELRGTGGFIGNWGELEADGGKLHLSRFGRLDELIFGATGPPVLHAPEEFLQRYRGFDVAGSWQQVNVSPDFPTTARVISELYPQSGGRPVDGVIAVDPPGLAALLELTGPVEVAGWPDPITAANVVDVTLRAAYERYPVQDDRVEFLGAVARRVWEAFTTAELGNPARIAQSLSRASRDGHLMAYAAEPPEQALISRLGADGAVPPLAGDFLMLVDQNLSANKVDLYLQRRLRYDAVLDPSSEPARMSGRLEVTLENGAPSKGLPEGVIGPYDNRFAPGENRTYLSIYSPFPGRSTTLEGRPFDLDTQPELGRLAHSATLSIPAKESRTVTLELEGRMQLDGGWYRLDLGHQPLVLPDEVEVSIGVPPGWRIAETRDMERTGSRQAATRTRLERDRTLWVRVERSGWSGFWHRLTGE